jgi:outer membrane protein assembly factor BamB
MIGKLDVFPHNIAVCSPVLVGDKVWLVTANGVNEDHLNVPSPRAPSFIAVDKKTGEVKWQNNMPTVRWADVPKDKQEASLKQLINRGELIQHGQWSNPAYAKVDGQGQIVFPGGDGWIYSFGEDGTLLWRFDCNPKEQGLHRRRPGPRARNRRRSPVVHPHGQARRRLPRAGG